MDWNWAKKKFEHIVEGQGVWLQWLQRVTSGSEAFLTGSELTWGYGDVVNYWITGSCKAIVQHVSATDSVQEAGFYSEDIIRIYVDPDETIDFWDQILYPSGSQTRYLILPSHIWRITTAGAGTIISKYFLARKLVPKSGSTY